MAAVAGAAYLDGVVFTRTRVTFVKGDPLSGGGLSHRALRLRLGGMPRAA